LSVATVGKDGNRLKLEKLGQLFHVLMQCQQNSTKTVMVSAPALCYLGHISTGAFCVWIKAPSNDATYPSPKPTLTLTSHLGKNVGLGKG